MKRDDLLLSVDNTAEACKKLLTVKGREYSGEDDCLLNFKRAGLRRGISPLAVLMIYLDKHLDAINQHVLDVASGKVVELSEPIDGRINDAINYLLLLKGLLHEPASTLVSPRSVDVDGNRNGRSPGDSTSRIPSV